MQTSIDKHEGIQSLSVDIAMASLRDEQLHTTLVSYMISHDIMQAAVYAVRQMRVANGSRCFTQHCHSPLLEQQPPSAAVAAAFGPPQQLL